MMDADEHGNEDEKACAIFGSNSGDGAQSEQNKKGKRQNSFPCHQEKVQCQQSGMEKVIVKTSDQMVVPNGMMEQGKEQNIMKDSMSEEVMLQSKKVNQIEQQEGRHGKRHKSDNTYYIELRKEDIETGEWKVDGRKKEHHKPVVKDAEENAIRGEIQKCHKGFSVELREKDGVENGDDRNVQEDQERLSVEPRENKDAIDNGNMDIEVDTEELTVEFEEKKTFQDVKDEEKCSIGEEETNKGEGSFAFYFSDDETSHSMEENKVREIQGEREDKQMSGEMENQNVPKIVREAVSRFKEKAQK